MPGGWSLAHYISTPSFLCVIYSALPALPWSLSLALSLGRALSLSPLCPSLSPSLSPHQIHGLCLHAIIGFDSCHIQWPAKADFRFIPLFSPHREAHGLQSLIDVILYSFLRSSQISCVEDQSDDFNFWLHDKISLFTGM